MILLFLMQLKPIEFEPLLEINYSIAKTFISKADYSDKPMINITNRYRQSIGLDILKEDTRLNSSAQAKANHLCTFNYWAHIAPDGTTPWDFILNAGYNYSLAGENLTRKFTNDTKAFNALIDSPTHLDNIVEDYQHIGVGKSYCGGKNYMAIHYGRL